MVEEKLEPRLRALIDHEMARAAATGAAPTEVEEAPLTVTISAEETITAPEGAEDQREDALTELGQRIE
jgi:hypothetical protein